LITNNRGENWNIYNKKGAKNKKGGNCWHSFTSIINNPFPLIMHNWILITVRLTSIHIPKIKATSLRFMVGQPTYFMVAKTSLSSELVLATIEEVMAPLEVGLEIALI
jgi:hypothetical protein